VATLVDPLGKVVIKTGLLYNASEVKNFTLKDFSLYRSDGSYFSIDKNGTITLKKNLPYRRLYSFQISMLYTVSLVGNSLPVTGFLTAETRIQAIGMTK